MTPEEIITAIAEITDQQIIFSVGKDADGNRYYTLRDPDQGATLLKLLTRLTPQ